MQPQGLELMRLSLANIELVKKIIQFSTVFTTFLMVLVEVKTQNSFFMVRQNYLNTWRMMGGEYQKFERTLAKTAP